VSTSILHIKTKGSSGKDNFGLYDRNKNHFKNSKNKIKEEKNFYLCLKGLGRERIKSNYIREMRCEKLKDKYPFVSPVKSTIIKIINAYYLATLGLESIQLEDSKTQKKNIKKAVNRAIQLNLVRYMERNGVDKRIVKKVCKYENIK
jgi:hypothetical protein